jgi:hypothetical protein
MKDPKDDRTIDAVDALAAKRRPGRPRGTTPALTPAERQKRYRERAKAAQEASPSVVVEFTNAESCWVLSLLQDEARRLALLVMSGHESSRPSMAAADVMADKVAAARRKSVPSPS